MIYLLKNKKIGLGITGSFCSMDDMLYVIDWINKNNGDLYVFLTNTIRNFDTRFNLSSELIKKIETRIKRPLIDSVEKAEEFGPKIALDLMIVYPCSANTLAKVVHGVNDNAVTMACKGTLRNQNNILLGIYTNDALSTSGKNIMNILNTKQFYLVPMYQDNIIDKPTSMIASVNHIDKAIICAMDSKQAQPVFLGEING